MGLGMLKKGTGKLNIPIKKQNLKTSKKMEQRMNKKSGLESTLNLGAHQGIELINPALKNERSAEQKGNQSYFSKEAGFRTVLNSKIGKWLRLLINYKKLPFEIEIHIHSNIIKTFWVSSIFILLKWRNFLLLLLFLAVKLVFDKFQLVFAL